MSISSSIHCVYCDNVIVRGISISDPDQLGSAHNNDGINLDSCRNALVEYCTIDTSDDCLAMKSGLNEDGMRVNRPTENVVVRRCLSQRGNGGVTIGSDMSGGVRRLYAHDCIFDRTKRGIRLKSARGRGGIVEDAWYRNIATRNIRDEAITINAFYTAWAVTNDGKAPLFRNLHIQDVTCKGAKTAVEITGLPDQAIENVTLKNVSISAQTGLKATDVRGLELSDVTIISESSK